MPNSVKPAPLSVSPLGSIEVLPYSLALAYESSSSWVVDKNTYVNGEATTFAWTEPGIGFRRSWALTRRLTVDQLRTLQAFYLIVQGPLIAFKFYDVYETDPLFSYDLSGGAIKGLYYVRFDGDLTKTILPGRSQLNFALKQIS